MADQKDQGRRSTSQDDDVRKTLDEHAKRRRELLKHSAKIAVTTPLVAALLAPGSRPAFAGRYAPPTTTGAATTNGPETTPTAAV